MKNFMILALCLIILVTSSVMQLNYLCSTSKYLISDVEYIENLVRNGSYNKALNHCSQLENTWENMSNMWGVFINYSETDILKEHMVRLKESIEIEDESSVYVNVALIINKLKGVVRKQEPHLESVF